jgi:DHA1 family multidrug resistance protein-like MFS transporter
LISFAIYWLILVGKLYRFRAAVLVVSSNADRKTLALLSWYNLTSSFAGNLVAPFMPIFLYQLAGNRFFQTSIASQTSVIVSVVMGLFWGRLSDVKGRRKRYVQLGIATGSLASLALSFANTIEMAIAVQALGAFTGCASGAAFSALLAEKFRDRRGSRLGLYSAAGVVGGFSGSLASGALYSYLGFRWLLRLNALLSLIPLLLVSLLEEDGNPGREVGRFFGPPRIPGRFWKIFIARIILTLPGALSSGLYAIYFVKFLGGPPEAWSALIAVTTLLGLASIPYGKLADRLTTRQMFTVAGLGWTALYLGYYASPNYLWFSLFFIIPVWPAFWLAYSKALMDLSDESERATFYALEGTLSAIFGSLVSILAGYLADLYTPRSIFLLSATAALASTLIVNALLGRQC